jgi:CDP-diacylglycerol--glycerol-3-phosphate 3-phosphatidyltransferase
VNLPNILTVSRIVLTFIIIHLVHVDTLAAKIAAFTLFLIASLTDWLDGYLARKMKLISPWGQLMDPIADKILIFGVFLAFVDLDLVPAWIVLIMLSREVVVTGIRFYEASRGKVIAARQSGKHKTVIQFVCIVVILLFLMIQNHTGWVDEYKTQMLLIIDVLLYMAAALTIYSGLRFIQANWSQID